MNHLKSNMLRRPGFWLLAGSALALTTLMACNSSSGSDPKEELCPDSYAAGSYDSLHVPLCVMADTGAALYEGFCTNCHNAGNGSAGFTPPHKNADFVQQNKYKMMQIVLGGYEDSLKVNGLWYTGGMPSFALDLSNHEVASVLTYIRVMLNDSTVGTCDTAHLVDGFATCQKTLRTVGTRKSDSVAVWEVKHVRDSIEALPD
jgi:hypothetical protein